MLQHMQVCGLNKKTVSIPPPMPRIVINQNRQAAPKLCMRPAKCIPDDLNDPMAALSKNLHQAPHGRAHLHDTGTNSRTYHAKAMRSRRQVMCQTHVVWSRHAWRTEPRLRGTDHEGPEPFPMKNPAGLPNRIPTHQKACPCRRRHEAEGATTYSQASLPRPPGPAADTRNPDLDCG